MSFRLRKKFILNPPKFKSELTSLNISQFLYALIISAITENDNIHMSENSIQFTVYYNLNRTLRVIHMAQKVPRLRIRRKMKQT